MTSDTKYINIPKSISVPDNSSLQIPNLCPICNVSHNPLISKHFENNISEGHLYGFTQKCTACHKYSFSLHERKQSENNKYIFDIVFIYPFSSDVKFHKLIKKLSPRFVDIYRQSQYCEDQKFTDLAATGYRSALEILIKDYALDFNLDTQDEISKLNLNNVISKYFKNENDALISADVVRIMGNSFTHWDKDQDASLDEIKYYMHIFINYIEMKLRLKTPPASR